MGPADAPARAKLLVLLERLHRHKDAAYGDAWRKRGEVIAIFANMARKYDRLVVAFDEQRPAATEPLADTIADLCVYAGKYLTWIADEHPEELEAAGLAVTAVQISDARGPDGLQAVLAVAAEHPLPPPADAMAAWRQAQESFGALEHALMAQATPDAPANALLSFSAKAQLAWKLVGQTAWLVYALQHDDPAALDTLRKEVAAMDLAATA